MTHNERQQAYNIINSTLQYLTDEELKAITCMVLSRTTCDGTPITNI